MLRLGDLIRRVFVKSQDGPKWKVEGYETDDGVEGADDDEGIDVFLGFGVYVKPSEEAEAIVAHVGATSEHPVIVAVRDESARAAFIAKCGDIATGELAIFNKDATAVVILKSDGTALVKATTIQMEATDIEAKPTAKMKVSPTPAILLPLADGVVHGTAVDTFTGVALWVLGGSSAVLECKK